MIALLIITVIKSHISTVQHLLLTRIKKSFKIKQNGKKGDGVLKINILQSIKTNLQLQYMYTSTCIYQIHQEIHCNTVQLDNIIAHACKIFIIRKVEPTRNLNKDVHKKFSPSKVSGYIAIVKFNPFDVYIIGWT